MGVADCVARRRARGKSPQVLYFGIWVVSKPEIGKVLEVVYLSALNGGWVT